MQENGTWGRVKSWYKKGKELYKEYDEKYKLKTRYEGFQKMQTGAALGAAAAPFCAASEFVLPAVACVGLGTLSADNLAAGAQQLTSGQEVPTMTSQLAKSGTKALGGSDRLADAVAKGTEAPGELLDAKEKAEKAMKVGAWIKSKFKKSPPPPPKKPQWPPDDIQ